MKPALPIGMRQSLLVLVLFLLTVACLANPGAPLTHKSWGHNFNTAPVAIDDYGLLTGNTTFDSNFSGNDFDPDGESLSMDNNTIVPGGPHDLVKTMITQKGGCIKFYADGLYSFTPALNYSGFDQVTYTICDVNPLPLCSSATIYFTIMPSSRLPLPVNLLQFTGKRSGKDNLLQWITAQENNLHHFELEMSTDNRIFTTIATVNAKGNMSIQQQYSSVDRSAISSVNYYRLKLVDWDRKAAYSKIVAIRGDGSGIILNTVYPNPFHDKIELALTSDRVQPIAIRLYDMSGKLCASKEVPAVKGLNVISMKDMEKLQPGMYFLKVTGTIVLMETKLLKK
jgi:hypothetical protein